MKKLARQIKALVIVMAMVISLGAFAFAAEFTDMPSKEHWAHDALNAAVNNGLLKGDSNKLNPTGNLSRAEMATIINRAFGAAQTADMSRFNDVAKSSWYYIEMAKAVKMGTFNGDGATMRPEASITRQEAFVVLARALQLKSDDVAELKKFSDNALIADWAKPEFAAMASAGYVNGDNGKANPTGTITRQEFAQVMYNAIKTYINKAETVTSVSTGNVMVNVPGATLKNLTVKGDLIVGDGVGAGDFTLDNSKVEGRVIVRGGGENSIKIINGSNVSNIIISKTSDGGVRVWTDSNSTVQIIVIADGNDSVIVEGKVDTLTIEGKVEVEIKGEVGNVEVKSDAKGATIEVAKGAKVEKLDSKASDVKVAGEGKITEATVSGNNTKLDVPGTTVTVDNGVEGTVVGDKPVPGGSVVVAEPSKPTPPDGGTVGTSPVENYATQIDSAVNSMCSIINTALGKLSDETAKAVTVSLEASTNKITVKYPTPHSGYTALGDVYNKISGAGETGELTALITNVIKYVKEISAGNNAASHKFDVASKITNASIPETKGNIRTYIGEITFTNRSTSTEETISTTTNTADLPLTFNVTVLGNDGNTYTYTIVREWK